MIVFLVMLMGWQDIDIIRCETQSDDVLGDIPTTGLFQLQQRPVRMEMKELFRTALDFTIHLLNRIGSSCDDERD